MNFVQLAIYWVVLGGCSIAWGVHEGKALSFLDESRDKLYRDQVGFEGASIPEFVIATYDHEILEGLVGILENDDFAHAWRDASNILAMIISVDPAGNELFDRLESVALKIELDGDYSDFDQLIAIADVYRVIGRLGTDLSRAFLRERIVGSIWNGENGPEIVDMWGDFRHVQNGRTVAIAAGSGRGDEDDVAFLRELRDQLNEPEGSPVAVAFQMYLDSLVIETKYSGQRHYEQAYAYYRAESDVDKRDSVRAILDDNTKTASESSSDSLEENGNSGNLSTTPASDFKGRRRGVVLVVGLLALSVVISIIYIFISRSKSS